MCECAEQGGAFAKQSNHVHQKRFGVWGLAMDANPSTLWNTLPTPAFDFAVFAQGCVVRGLGFRG